MPYLELTGLTRVPLLILERAANQYEQLLEEIVGSSTVP